MRPKWLVGLVVLVSLVAGCMEGPGFSPDGDEGESDHQPPELAGLEVDFLGVDEKVEDWSMVSFEVEAEAGGWLTFSQPIPPATSGQYDIHVVVDMEAEGDGGINWMFTPLRFVFEEVQEPGLWFHRVGHVDESNHTFELTSAASWGSGSEITSHFFMFGSDSAWSMRFFLGRGGAGNSTVPEFLSGGKDAVFKWGGERESHLGEAVFDLNLEKNIERTGWTNLRVLRSGTTSIGADLLFATFTDGYEHSRAHTLDEPGPEEKDTDHYVGLMDMPAGTFQAGLHHASTTESVDLGLFHLPVDDDDFPAEYEWAIGYSCSYSKSPSLTTSACNRIQGDGMSIETDSGLSHILDEARLDLWFDKDPSPSSEAASLRSRL